MSAPPRISTDILEGLVGQLVLPCEWQRLGGQSPPGSGQWVLEECGEPAVWSLRWRVFCANGWPFRSDIPGAPTLVCERHFRRVCTPEGSPRLVCSACRLPWSNVKHVLDSWVRI